MTTQIISMRKFGSMGRFGNQLFQYMFIRLYAQRYGLRYELPPWVGDLLFGFWASDNPVRANLPQYTEQYTGGPPNRLDAGYPVPPGPEVCGHDFHGWAQYHTSYYRPYRQEIKRMFSATQSVHQRMAPAVKKLNGKGGRTVVGVHLRRGDYGQMYFYITPVEWYLRLLDVIWDTVPNPILFIATETPSLVEEFAAFEPETAESLGIELVAEEMPHYKYLTADLQVREPLQLDFFPDFYLLANCDVLLIPNTSFSYVAAMLNPNLQALYRSDLPTQSFEKIDPWNSWPVRHDWVDDYMHPGTYLDTNPPYYERRVLKNGGTV